MIEIYRDTAEKVELKLYVSGNRVDADDAVTVAVTDVNGDVITASSPTDEEVDASGKKVYSYIINLDATTHERSLNVVWSYTLLGTDATKTDVVDVVTPYCTPDEVTSFDPNVGTTFTYEQIRNAEKQVRRIIDNYTGQKFGKYTGTNAIIGQGEGQLLLPERLISVTNIEGYNVLTTDDPTNGALYRVRGDGWVLGVVAEPDQLGGVTNGVIYAPGCEPQAGGFKDNYVYEVEGVWGYDRVPADVNQAALILIQQMLCPDTEYRDRYIDNIRAADWRYEFNPSAFSGTGNVVADQLLAPYRRINFTVI